MSVSATVTADPRRFTRFGTTAALVRVDATQVTISHNDYTVSGHAPVIAAVADDASDLSVGRRVVLHGRLGPATDRDTVAVLQVDRRLPSEPGGWWWSGADRIRRGVRDAVRDARPDERALVPALVDGDDGRVSDRVQEEFRRTGLTHLLAVSGTNLTIVLLMALAIARAAGVGRRRMIAVGVVAVLGFVLLARPDPSVLRAAGMGCVGLVAVAVGGRGGMRSLCTSVVALLFIEPWLARAPGFVLSVCATGGILVLSPALAARLSRWMPHGCAIAIAVPLAAQVACTPAVVALSGQLSIVGVLANVLAAPLVAPATVAGLGGGLIDLVSPTLAGVVGIAASSCASAILGIAHMSSGFAGAAVPWRAPWWILVVLMPLTMALLVRAAARPAIAVGIAVGVCVGMVRPPQLGWPPANWLMVACDVGQGDATVLNAGHGSAILVDTGPEPLSIDGCLRRLHVRQLPLLVITHAHADHIAGWSGAVRRRSVGWIVEGPSGAPGGDGRLASAGDAYRVGRIALDVVWPPAGVAAPDAQDGSAMNNSSVVLRVSIRGVRLLLAGDIETEAQDAIVDSGSSVAADVLKFPHHGSSRQSEEFLRAVGARIATISVGQGNDYGHPAASALHLLARDGVDWRRTDIDGDIAITLRNGRINVVTRR